MLSDDKGDPEPIGHASGRSMSTNRVRGPSSHRASNKVSSPVAPLSRRLRGRNGGAGCSAWVVACAGMGCGDEPSGIDDGDRPATASIGLRGHDAPSSQ